MAGLGRRVNLCAIPTMVSSRTLTILNLHNNDSSLRKYGIRLILPIDCSCVVLYVLAECVHGPLILSELKRLGQCRWAGLAKAAFSCVHCTATYVRGLLIGPLPIYDRATGRGGHRYSTNLRRGGRRLSGRLG